MMTDALPLHIPSREELHAAVMESLPPKERMPEVHAKPSGLPCVGSSTEYRLSLESVAFLQYSALPAHMGFCLEQHWAGIGIGSGSVKRRVLHELKGRGLIALEKKGKALMVRLFPEAWAVLGITPTKGLGTGGSLHKAIVNRLAHEFKTRGYDVHVEFPVGPERKRVDLVAFGSVRLGIEVGLTDPIQELKNVRADLASGALDFIIFCSNNKTILDRVYAGVHADPLLLADAHRIRFFLFKE